MSQNRRAAITFVTSEPPPPDYSDLIRAFDALIALLQQIRKLDGEEPFVSRREPPAGAAEGASAPSGPSCPSWGLSPTMAAVAEEIAERLRAEHPNLSPTLIAVAARMNAKYPNPTA